MSQLLASYEAQAKLEASQGKTHTKHSLRGDGLIRGTLGPLGKSVKFMTT